MRSFPSMQSYAKSVARRAAKHPAHSSDETEDRGSATRMRPASAKSRSDRSCRRACSRNWPIRPSSWRMRRRCPACACRCWCRTSGAEHALDAGADLMLVPLGEPRPQHREPAQDARRSRRRGRIRARDAAGSKTLIEGGIGTAFGCTIQPRRAVGGAALPACAARCRRRPREPRRYGRLRGAGRRRRTVRRAPPPASASGAAIFTTPAASRSRMYAALETGVARFDATLAGIGGCPHARRERQRVERRPRVHACRHGNRDRHRHCRVLTLRAKVARWLDGETLHGARARACRPPTPPRPPSPPEPIMNHDTRLPLDGIRVIEFTHMVMGPTCGMILADLGAEVIKIEPPGGDKTRNLPGLGIGFFRSFNRNKKSVVLDLHTPEGKQAAVELIGTCDVMLENFRPGLMATLGLDYDTLSARYPALVYVTHRASCPARTTGVALDEVVQMMGGLSHDMTGRPLRAGTSVNDIMGGMFGAIGVSPLRERERTGRGQEVQSALFENCVFLCAQHMQQYAMTHEPPPPMPARVSAWSVTTCSRSRTANSCSSARSATGSSSRSATCSRLRRRTGVRHQRAAGRRAAAVARTARRDPEGPSRRRAVAETRSGRHSVCADRPSRTTARRSAPESERRTGADADRRRPRPMSCCCRSRWADDGPACARRSRASASTRRKCWHG